MKNQSLIICIVVFIIVITSIIIIINKFKSTEKFSNENNNNLANNNNNNNLANNNNNLEFDTNFIKTSPNVVSVDKLNNKVINVTTDIIFKDKIDEILNNQLNTLNISDDPTNPSLYDNLMKKVPGIDSLPIGTILIWNNEVLPPSNNWIWCDGAEYNNVTTPDFRYRFPLGRNMSNEEDLELDLPEGENEPVEKDNDGCITIDNLPSHSHSTKTTINGSHNHGGRTNKKQEFSKKLYVWSRDSSDKLAGSPKTSNPWNHGADHRHYCNNAYHKHEITFKSTGQNKENIKPFFPKNVLVKYIIKIK